MVFLQQLLLQFLIPVEAVKLSPCTGVLATALTTVPMAVMISPNAVEVGIRSSAHTLLCVWVFFTRDKMPCFVVGSWERERRRREEVAAHELVLMGGMLSNTDCIPPWGKREEGRGGGG